MPRSSCATCSTATRRRTRCPALGGGLQTRGKHYLARAENIARYADGAFNPRGEVDEQAPALCEAGLELSPRPIPPAAPLDPRRPLALLLTAEDLAPEHSALAGPDVAGVAGGRDATIGVRLGLSDKVVGFTRSALADALARAGEHFEVRVTELDDADWIRSAEDWARGLGQVATLEAPVGPWRERLAELAVRLAGRVIRLVAHRRPLGRAPLAGGR